MPAEPMLELHWSAPAECPDSDRVVARVEELVGRMPEGRHTLVAGGVVTSRAEAPRYVLALVIGDSPMRVMSGDDCEKLTDAAVLIIALDIDPDAGSRPIEPPPPPPPPEVLPPRPKPSPPPPPPPRSISAFLGARALVDSGSLPRTTLGLGATFAVAKGWISAELDAIGWSSQFTVVGPHNGVSGAYIGLTTFGLRGCAMKHIPSLDLLGCLGGELGVESSRGVRIQQPQTSSSLWSAVAATVRVKVWPTLPVSPTVGLTLGRPVSAPSVVIEPFGTVFSPPTAFLRGFLGLEAQFF